MTDQTNDGDLKQDELATLKARADMLGINYHPSIGLDKLKEKIAANLAEETAAPVAPVSPVAPVASAGATAPVAPASLVAPVAAPYVIPQPETDGQRKRRLKNEALKLVRVRITCMNPAKKEWHGEIFTVGNSAIGSVTKFVPFEAEDGYHIPHILLEQLRGRQCQIFVNDKAKNGVVQRRGKLIREFAIEVLPDLNGEELAELAARQAATRAID